MTTSLSLFDRLGGAPVVRAAVEEFFKRLLEDERLAFFFEDVKMTSLKMHQLEFFKLAFMEIPDDLDMPGMLMEKHRCLFQEQGLNETHFDLVSEHFLVTLEHLKISQELIDEAVAVVLPLRSVFEAGPIRYGRKEKDGDEEKKEESHVLHASVESTEKPETLMDRLGGNAAVKAAIEGLYTRILADKDLAQFFENISMTLLKIHQLEFLKIAFTQIPDDLNVGAFIMEKHSKLFKNGLNVIHFDNVVAHFVATLRDLQVKQELIDEALAVIAPLWPVFEQAAIEAS